ncbi:MAG TPA: hypothetical protein VGM76_17535 [Lacipirellulaceae bacterium]|jgi:hypothetical protein
MMTVRSPKDEMLGRPRLSLRTALLLVAIVGLSIVVIQLWRKVAPLRAEVRKLQDLTGVITIEDPSKAYAIQVQTLDDLTWKWRAWIPRGHRVLANYHWGQVPRDSFPQPDGTIQLNEGDNWVTLSARKDPSDGSWKGVLATEGGRNSSPIGQGQSWVELSHGAEFYGVGMSTAVWLDEHNRFLLLNYRVPPKGASGTANPADELRPGFVIWLEQP